MSIKNDVLERANDLISDSRMKTSGPPSKNFDRTAKLWSVILQRETTPVEVALCMDAMKLSRIVNQINSEVTTTDVWGLLDDFVDKPGYSALAAELWCDELIRKGVLGNTTREEQE